ncbi:MAG: DNA-binding CsgD family transcriptional regulator [Myxococcota bacterium]|jgi:DNA-binding CsgD family transcriptional regulator
MKRPGSSTMVSTLLECVEHMSVGVVLVRDGGILEYVNEAALQLFALDDGLSAHEDMLYASITEDQEALQALIEKSLAGGGGAVLIRRPSGWLPYQAVSVPLAGGMPPRLLVPLFLSDPAHQLQAYEACLKALYGLTETEATIADQIAHGMDIRQIAVHRHCGVETVRSHVKRLFDKTGTRRQIDLVRLVLAGAATIHRAG